MDETDIHAIYATWLASCPRGANRGIGDEFCLRTYYRALCRAKERNTEMLCEQIWAWVEMLRMCSNGGHECFLTPDGDYTCSFDLESSDDDETNDHADEDAVRELREYMHGS